MKLLFCILLGEYQKSCISIRHLLHCTAIFAMYTKHWTNIFWYIAFISSLTLHISDILLVYVSNVLETVCSGDRCSYRIENDRLETCDICQRNACVLASRQASIIKPPKANSSWKKTCYCLWDGFIYYYLLIMQGREVFRVPSFLKVAKTFHSFCVQLRRDEWT